MVVAVTALLVGCGSRAPEGPTKSPEAALRDLSRVVLEEQCAGCHVGGGPGAVADALAVFDLRQPAWSSTMTPAHLRSVIARLDDLKTRGVPEDERAAVKGWMDHELAAAEVTPQPLPLAGDAADGAAELSGLAWYDAETLVLLPEHKKPPYWHGGEPRLYTLSRAQLARAIAGDPTPLEPRAVPLDFSGFEQRIPNWDGMESIVFDGRKAYLTVEAKDEGDTRRGHLVSARIIGDLERVVLERSVMLPKQAPLTNKSYEAVAAVGEYLFAFPEAPDPAFFPNPFVARYTRDLEPAGHLPLPRMGWRLTDVAQPAGDHIWAINYYYPGDETLGGFKDDLVARYGAGLSHGRSRQVERLLRLEVGRDALTLVDEPPIQLSLVEDARNWEGMVRWPEGGFVVVTDRFPRTILAYVARPDRPWSSARPGTCPP